MASEMDIQVTETCPRKISHRLDEDWRNEHVMVSNDDKYRVTFFYEVLDTIL